MVCGRLGDFWRKPELIYVDKYAYTGILLLTHLIYATSSTTFGPTFVDLQFTVDSSISTISLFPTVFSVGNTLGTLFGLVFKYVNRQLTLICLLLLMAITSTVIPFTREVWQLFLCAFFFGMGAGAWITAYNVWLIEMWQRRAGKVLFLSQVMYGIGSVLGPLIDGPYVTGEPARNETTGAVTIDEPIISVEDRRHKLAVPYMISGGIQIIFPTILVIMFFTRKYQYDNIKRMDSGSGDHTPDPGSGPKLFDRCSQYRRIVMITLIATCLSAVNSLDLIYFNFLSVYLQYIPAHIDATRAAQMASALGTAYTVGQAVNFFVAMILSEKIMIGYHFLITIVSIVGLFFVQHSDTGLWVLSIAVGYGFSLLYPGVLSYTGRYIEITNRLGTILWFSCGAVQFIPPIILVGLVFKYVNRQLTLICLLLLMGITSTVIPFTRQAWQLSLCALLFGMGAGAWITAYNVWLIEMWQRRAGKVLFLSQVMYGIGSVMASFIDGPYVTGEPARNETTGAVNTDEPLISVEDRRHKVSVSYMISGGIQIIFPTILFIMFFTRKYQYNNIKRTDSGSADNSNSDPGPELKLFDRCLPYRRIVIITLIATCLSSVNSLDLIFFNYLSKYLQYIPAHINTTRGAQMTLGLGTAYTVGQVVNFFVSMILSEKIMIGYHFLITIVSIVGLIFVHYSDTGLMVLNITTGYGCRSRSPILDVQLDDIDPLFGGVHSFC
ncbi:unnamed protein product [Medioppia subpectinata]|uniref:Uncharacterized protein n=1 Tax=Medioppia subpectinata TaxID=1979941 RepID=A0A7R9KGP2_9ACAR|nr:unnamed protein product [Medioppia subpectinata]CAG2103216.1 unnamed protein product [Medioppia subpectinata]